MPCTLPSLLLASFHFILVQIPQSVGAIIITILQLRILTVAGNSLAGGTYLPTALLGVSRRARIRGQVRRPRDLKCIRQGLLSVLFIVFLAPRAKAGTLHREKTTHKAVCFSRPQFLSLGNGDRRP